MLGTHTLNLISIGEIASLNIFKGTISPMESRFKVKSYLEESPKLLQKKPILYCSCLLIFKLRRNRWQIYIIEIAVYGENGEIELTQGQPTKSLQRISRQICENSKFREFGGRTENVQDSKDV